MELRLYWQIVKKRLWLVAALVGLFALSYAIWGTRPPTTYSAAMRFTVGLKPELSDGTYYTYDRYYAWRTAEYLLDDLAEVIKSAAFAQDVAQLSGLHIPPGTIQGATSAGKLHRILTVIISWPDPDELGRISEASVHILQNQSDRYFSQLATDSAVVALIDPPAIGPVDLSLRQRLDLPLRLLLALLTGIALTFVLDYLDDTVRHSADLADTQLPILAEIPTCRSWLANLLRPRSTP